MSFGDHLEALRPHLVRSVVAWLVLMVVAFCFKELLVDRLLLGPLRPDFPTNRWLAALGQHLGIEELAINSRGVELISTTMAGQFNLHLKLSMLAALTLAFPYMLWELWRFVKPALTPRELHACRHAVGCVSLGFFTGIAFGYFIIAPLSINFLTNYQVSFAVENLIDIHSYLSTVIDISLACALLFQLPLAVYFLTRMGILSSTFMARYRRHAILLLAILSAIITPPDVFSMILVMLPLLLLYEGSISLARRVEKRKGESQCKM